MRILKSLVAVLMTAVLLCGCMVSPSSLPGTEEIARGLALQQEQTASNELFMNEMPLVTSPDRDLSGLLQTATSSADTVIYSLAPTKAQKLKGGSKLNISAYVKDGASVEVHLGDQIVKMSGTTKVSGSYRLYKATVTLPSAKSKDVNLGEYCVYATWKGYKKVMYGPTVTVQKKNSGLTANSTSSSKKGEDSLPLTDKYGRRLAAEVVVDSAEVFPISPLNDDSSPICYPLAKGTVDYVTSERLSFDYNDKTFYYYNLASGKRVYEDDVKLFYTEELEDSRVRSFTVDVDDDATELRFRTDWEIPYSGKLSPLTFKSGGGISSFWPTTFSITFDYTDSVPRSIPSLRKSPLFSEASWSYSKSEGISRCTLTMTLREKGVFFGVSSYYEDGELVFRFVNPPVIQRDADSDYGYTLEGVRIYLDPGHDAKDPGAISVDGSLYEADMNQALAARLKEELEELGATVKLLNTSRGSVPMKDRVENARDFQPHIYLSVHHNSSETNSSLSGVEAYYFNPYSMELGYRITQRVGSYYENKVYPDSSKVRNRGAKFGYMYVTRYMDFPSVLVECGYISNPVEITFLRKSSVRNNLARYITAGVVDYFVSNAAEIEGDSSGSVKRPASSSSTSSGSTSGKKLILIKK